MMSTPVQFEFAKRRHDVKVEYKCLMAILHGHHSKDMRMNEIYETNDLSHIVRIRTKIFGNMGVLIFDVVTKIV